MTLMQSNRVDLESVVAKEERRFLPQLIPQSQSETRLANQTKKLPKIYSDALYSRLADVKERMTSP